MESIHYPSRNNLSGEFIGRKVRSLRRNISGRRNRKQETYFIEEEVKKRELYVGNTENEDKNNSLPFSSSYRRGRIILY